MEIGLQIIEENQIAVTCNQEFSHSFPGDILAPIYAEEIPSDPIAIGKILYENVFFEGTKTHTALSTNPERILLVPQDPELDAIPWEALYGPDGFLVLDFPFIRGLPEEKRIPVPDLSDIPLHVYAVLSNPLSEKLERLNTKVEWTQLKENLDGLTHAIQLDRVYPPTLDQTRILSANKKYSVIHFMGHGEADRLIFEQENGAEHPVSAQQFCRRIENDAYLITLTACKSAMPVENQPGLAYYLVNQDIPYVLGMRHRIREEDAGAFSKTFFAELFRGSSIENAVRQARFTLYNENDPLATIMPQLYTALQVPGPVFHTPQGNPEINKNAPPINILDLVNTESLFQGRVIELRKLGKWLTGRDHKKLITIRGVGGQGKTALACEAVERLAHAWHGGVYAISLGNIFSLSAFCVHLARAMQMQVEIYPQEVDLINAILFKLSEKRILLLLDNAETLLENLRKGNNDAVLLFSFIRDRIRSTPTGLLVTSHEPLGWPGEEIIKLEGLSNHEGAALFYENAPQRQKTLQFPKLEELSESLQGHPLALLLLAKSFNQSGCNWDDFIASYKKHLLAAQDLYKNEDHRHRTLFACINTGIQTLNEEQKKILSILWIFQSPFLPQIAQEIFSMLYDDDLEKEKDYSIDFQQQLYTLWMRGLLIREEYTLADGNLAFYHTLPVIRLFIEAYLHQDFSEEILYQSMNESYFELAEKLYNEMDQKASASFTTVQCRADLEFCIETMPEEKRAQYANHLGWILQRIGDRVSGFEYLKLAQNVSHDQKVGLSILNNMALVYDSTGQPARALELYQQALPIRREVGDRAGEAVTRFNMAMLFKNENQPTEAIEYMRQAVKIEKEIPHPDYEQDQAILNAWEEAYANGRPLP